MEALAETLDVTALKNRENISIECKSLYKETRAGRERFLLGQAGRSQKAERLHGIIHLRTHLSVIKATFL